MLEKVKKKRTVKPRTIHKNSSDKRVFSVCRVDDPNKQLIGGISEWSVANKHPTKRLIDWKFIIKVRVGKCLVI